MVAAMARLVVAVMAVIVFRAPAASGSVCERCTGLEPMPVCGADGESYETRCHAIYCYGALAICAGECPCPADQDPGTCGLAAFPETMHQGGSWGAYQETQADWPAECCALCDADEECKSYTWMFGYHYDYPDEIPMCYLYTTPVQPNFERNSDSRAYSGNKISDECLACAADEADTGNPVCGADGKTYASECEASFCGLSIAVCDGACPCPEDKDPASDACSGMALPHTGHQFGADGAYEAIDAVMWPAECCALCDADQACWSYTWTNTYFEDGSAPACYLYSHPIVTTDWLDYTFHQHCYSGMKPRGNGFAPDITDTCDGYCGGVNPHGMCWCEEWCLSYDDCCSDFEAVCVAAVPAPDPVPVPSPHGSFEPVPVPGPDTVPVPSPDAIIECQDCDMHEEQVVCGADGKTYRNQCQATFCDETIAVCAGECPCSEENDPASDLCPAKGYPRTGHQWGPEGAYKAIENVGWPAECCAFCGEESACLGYTWTNMFFGGEDSAPACYLFNTPIATDWNQAHTYHPHCYSGNQAREGFAPGLPGTCDGFCGGWNPHTFCYCDSVCVDYADCCIDYHDFCIAGKNDTVPVPVPGPGEPPEMTCEDCPPSSSLAHAQVCDADNVTHASYCEAVHCNNAQPVCDGPCPCPEELDPAQCPGKSYPRSGHQWGPEGSYQAIANVTWPAQCCAACGADSSCNAYTWTNEYFENQGTPTCYLFETPVDPSSNFIYHPDCFSGNKQREGFAPNVTATCGDYCGRENPFSRCFCDWPCLYQFDDCCGDFAEACPDHTMPPSTSYEPAPPTSYEPAPPPSYEPTPSPPPVGTCSSDCQMMMHDALHNLRQELLSIQYEAFRAAAARVMDAINAGHHGMGHGEDMHHP